MLALCCSLGADEAASPTGAGLEERLGQRLPLDVRLRDERGATVRLWRDLVGSGKPLVLIPGYYRCPMLCGLVLAGVAHGVRDLGWIPGDRFRIASFSFDAGETTTDAEMRQVAGADQLLLRVASNRGAPGSRSLAVPARARA